MTATSPEEVLSLKDSDGIELAVSRWMPTGPPRAVVQIAHGWGEHRRRYARPASTLVERGMAVYADDHLGHGDTGLRAGGLGDLRPRGMAGVVDGVGAVTERITVDLPGLPVFLLGHSWGSAIAMRYATLWGDRLAGLLLTGTVDRATSAARRAGRTASAPAPDDRPPSERYAWLTTDPEEVRAYVEDPLCGFESLRVRPEDPGWSYLYEGNDSALPRRLPVLVFNGADDPVGGGAAADRLGDHYRSAGLTDVTVRVYPGCRHELFNDVMRDRVLDDVAEWIDRRLPG